MSTPITSADPERKFKGDIKPELERLFDDRQPYLQHGYTIQEMSTSLDVPLYRLSAFINDVYAMRFTDFINLHRIEYAISLINQGKAFHWSLAGLARQCGFNNRNSFREAFKRFTGCIPSDYIKNKQAVVLIKSYKRTG